MKTRFAAILTLLILTALACANLGTGTSPKEPLAPMATTENSPTPLSTSPGEETAPENSNVPAGALLNLDDPTLYAQPSGMNSYRTTLVYNFEAPGPVTGSVRLDGATQVEPYATKIEFFTDGRAVMGNNEVFNFTQIQDTQYIVYTGFSCQSGTPGIQENPFAVMLNTGGMLTGEAQFLGEETVNGVGVYAYSVTKNNIDPNDPAGAGVETLTEGRIHVARDGGYVLRLQLTGTGRNELLSGDASLVGNIIYELNYLDFNQPVDIQIPQGCASEGNAEFKYPVPDDVVNLTDLGGMTAFNTVLDASATIEFYKTEMGALGCGAPQETVTGAAGSLAFPCPAGTVNILFAPGDSGGTAVTIFETP